jgi:hypothetical protein
VVVVICKKSAEWNDGFVYVLCVCVCVCVVF